MVQKRNMLAATYSDRHISWSFVSEEAVAAFFFYSSGKERATVNESAEDHV